MQFSQFVFGFVLALVAAMILYLILRKAPGPKKSAVPETGDPLADADSCMAYGDYENAKSLMKSALEREPRRTDFKMRLLEVCFVWGNATEFVAAAQKYESGLRDAGEWDKVEIMGKQIAPDDFS